MRIVHQDPKSASILDDSGFTLLEIIAVLVIMSILAVVAVPKYFDLQDLAKKKAMGVAVAEGVGRINGYFAEQVLSDVDPSEIDYMGTGVGTDLGDFSMVVSGDAASPNGVGLITLTITGRDGTPLEDETTVEYVSRPGIRQ